MIDGENLKWSRARNWELIKNFYNLFKILDYFFFLIVTKERDNIYKELLNI